MQPRTFLRDVKTGNRYVIVELSEDRRVQLRLPQMATLYRTIDLINGAADAWSRKQAAEASQDTDAMLAAIAETADLASAVVGLCWYHERLDLEADYRDFRTLQAYGSEVHEELTDAGFEDGDISILYGRLSEKIVEVIKARSAVEVKEATDFLDKSKGE